MNQIESQWDKLLKIKTTGRDDSRSDQYRYPYEPTQYLVLERLANSGLISKKNTVLDYGTGKGRACFYLSYQTRCRSVGVEYDERIFSAAESNREHTMLSEEATRAVIFTSGYATKALKEMDTRIQIFDMEEMILLLNANLGERWYADFERLKSNFMKEMS